jgi:serine/threonine-protein kinase
MEEPEYNALPAEFEQRMREKREQSRRQREQDSSTQATRFADYEFLELLGEGPTARVHRARASDGSVVALKILRRAVVRGVEREGARAEYLQSVADRLVAIRHPNLISVLGFERDGEETALVLSLHEESTLDDQLRKRPAFPWQQTLRLGVQLCDALAALHTAGIVHDDVKPRNILIDDAGAALLMDPNSARELSPSMSERAVALSGSPQFMAPERLRGETASERSDVYALAVVLFRMLTGRLPVKGPLVSQLREAHARGQLTELRSPLTKLPAAVVEVVQAALQLDPQARIATAREFGERLAAAEHAAAAPATKRSLTGRLRRLFARG